MLIALVAAVKMISVVIAGNSAVSAFRDGDAETLSGSVSSLSAVNVIERSKAPFAAGALAVLQGRLDDADARFSEALSLTDPEQSCPVLVNLELVRERRGDIDGWEGRLDQARGRYLSALDIVRSAPGGCFENNTDADQERRAVRNDTAARLAAKLDGTRQRTAATTARTAALHRRLRHRHHHPQREQRIPRDNQGSCGWIRAPATRPRSFGRYCKTPLAERFRRVASAHD